MHHTKLAVALALLLLPTGAVLGKEIQGQARAVEHHTSYVQLIADEGEQAPGFAAIAGIVSCKPTGVMADAVLWFDDQILFRTGRAQPDTACITEDEAGSHVWAAEEGAPDPREAPSLSPTGKEYAFTDPNGIDWVVTEYVYHQIHAYRQEETRVSVGDTSAGVGAEAEARFIPYYTWVVEIGPSVVDPTIEDHYNFVTVIDFDRLRHGPDGRIAHTGDGDPKDGDSHNASDPGERHGLPHAHDTAKVELWVGGEPEPGPGEAYHEGVRAERTTLLPSDIA